MKGPEGRRFTRAHFCDGTRKCGVRDSGLGPAWGTTGYARRGAEGWMR